MIAALEDIQVSWHRDVRPKYPNLNEPICPRGKPVEMVPSKETQVRVKLNLVYDKEHSPLVDDLLKAVRAIAKVVDQPPWPNPSCRHDKLGRCIRPEPWNGKDNALFKADQGWVCERCLKPTVTGLQAVLADVGR